MKGKCKIMFDFGNDGMKHATIKPDGFWSHDFINAHQGSGFGEGLWREPKIGWSSGGRDGSLGEIYSVKSFINAFNKAVEIAELWDKDTGKKVNGK